MTSLYPKHCLLPSLALIVGLAGCESAAPPTQQTEKSSNVYLEALQEAEAVKQTTDQRQSEQQRIDALLNDAGDVRR